MAKTVLVLIVLVMFSIGLFIVSKVGVFLKESKKEASDEREGVQLVKILEGIPGERTIVRGQKDRKIIIPYILKNHR